VSREDITIAAASAAIPPAGVLGFLVQCSICPQRAVVATQPAGDWVCPRCTAVAGGFGDVDIAQLEPVHTHPPSACRACHPIDGGPILLPFSPSDDDYPIGQVQG
jgi:hypothetical protein